MAMRTDKGPFQALFIMLQRTTAPLRLKGGTQIQQPVGIAEFWHAFIRLQQWFFAPNEAGNVVESRRREITIPRNLRRNVHPFSGPVMSWELKKGQI